MESHKYELQKGSNKHRCPQCQKKTLVRYVDVKNGAYLEHDIGKCDRLEKCGYHVPPKYSETVQAARAAEWEQKRANWQPSHRYTTPKRPVSLPKPKAIKYAYYPDDVLESTTVDANITHKGNVFYNNLMRMTHKKHPKSDVLAACSMYGVGTVFGGKYANCVTFPFIDENGRTVTIQVKDFDENNNTRKNADGKKAAGNLWLHNILDNSHVNYKGSKLWVNEYKKADKKNCLFGAHLLKHYPSNPIIIVESAKAAIYGAIETGTPDESNNTPIWLATGALAWLNIDRCKILKGRKVMLYPDVSHPCKAKGTTTFQKWTQRAAQIAAAVGCEMVVSDALERNATDEMRAEGYDIADDIQRKIWNS